MGFGKASRIARFGSLVALCAGLSSCASSDLRNAGYWGTRGAVAGAADEISRLNDAGALPTIDPEAMNGAVHDLTESAVVGAGDGAAKLKLDEALQALLEKLLQTAQKDGNALLTSVIEQQGPLLEKMARRLLVGTLRDARSELKTTTQTDLPQATRIVVSDAVDSFATALSGEKVVNLRRDLVDTTGEVTRTASVGAISGLREELQKPETLEAFGALAKRVVQDASNGAKDSVDKSTLWAAGIMFGTLFVLTVAALIFYIRKSLATSRALTVVASQINKGDHGELKKSIKAKAKDKNIESFLSDFLLDRGL